MALTVESQQRLERVGLVKFFSSSRDQWCNMAQESFEFVARNFPSGATIHRDDVSKALFTLIEVSEALAVYLSANKLHQKYWMTDFCDLIVDQCWEKLKVPSDVSGGARKK